MVIEVSHSVGKIFTGKKDCSYKNTRYPPIPEPISRSKLILCEMTTRKATMEEMGFWRKEQKIKLRAAFFGEAERQT